MIRAAATKLMPKPRDASYCRKRGYEAGQIEVLTHGPSSSGPTLETVTLFQATKLRRVGAGGGVAHENITVHEVTLTEVHDWRAG
jgi:ADP-ribose pyrophosphatase